jgi:hypothetical protein
VDEFEALKARVHQLRREIPSQRGCLARLRAEGEDGPLVEAAVEAVFNDLKDAARERYDDSGGERGSRFLRSLREFVRLLLLAALAFIPGTLLAREVFPKAELLSVAHLGCVGACLVGFKVMGAGHRALR